MKYNRLYAAFIFAFLAGCSGDGQYKEALLPQIDVNEEYPEKEIFLQDVLTLNIYHWKQMRKCCFRVQ